MKKSFYFFLLLTICSFSIKAQTVDVSGVCITGTITLNAIGNVNGKPAYENTGTVEGFSGVQVDIFWQLPDNIWVLAFSGQPYFQNACDIPTPPPTGNASCPWDTVSGQPCTGSNPLLISGSGTLGVKFISFIARAAGMQVDLYWQTATETNNRGFNIQRSIDGTSWSDIGFVNGNINSSIEKDYQFADLNPPSGVIFYRLIQEDLDNNKSYSNVISVKFLQSGFYYVTNNPGNGLYMLHIENNSSEKISFKVLDAEGRMIINRIYNGTGGQTIDLTNHPAGVYVLRIQNGKNLSTQKLIKL